MKKKIVSVIMTICLQPLQWVAAIRILAARRA